MSTLITILIVGTLLLAASSALALVFAIIRAEDGHEDASGYHSDAPGTSAYAGSNTMGSENPWDYVEGASCPLNLSHGFGPIGNNRLTVHQP